MTSRAAVGPGTLDSTLPRQRPNRDKMDGAIRRTLGLITLLLFQHIVHIDPNRVGGGDVHGTAMWRRPDAWLRNLRLSLIVRAIRGTTASWSSAALGN